MPKQKPKSRKKKPPKRVLALPDLEQAKAGVLNSLTSASGQRTYDHGITEFVAWDARDNRLLATQYYGCWFVDFYHLERNHQGLHCELIDRTRAVEVGGSRTHSRPRLGGLLNYYYYACC